MRVAGAAAGDPEYPAHAARTWRVLPGQLILRPN